MAGTREALDLALQRIGQPIRLAGAVDRERVVLERVELRQDAEPGRVRERRQHGGEAGQTGKARKARDPDHRRDQDDAVGPGKPRILDRFERIFHGQRAAVREPDQMQWPRGGHTPACLADRKPRGGHPIFPAHVGQAGRHGAVPRQADADRDEAAIAVELRDVPQAVGRVRQPVQQHHRADRLAVGFHDIRSVPVLGEARRIDRALREVAVDRHARVRIELLADLGANAFEDRPFLREIAGPIGTVEVALAQLGRHEGVPGLQRGAAQCPIRPQREHGRADHDDADQHPLQEPLDPHLRRLPSRRSASIAVTFTSNRPEARDIGLCPWRSPRMITDFTIGDCNPGASRGREIGSWFSAGASRERAACPGREAAASSPARRCGPSSRDCPGDIRFPPGRRRRCSDGSRGRGTAAVPAPAGAPRFAPGSAPRCKGGGIGMERHL